MMDGVDPGIVDDIRQVVSQIKYAKGITEIRVRWLGHRLYAEVNIAVDSGLSVKEGHEIAVNVRHKMLHCLDYISNAFVHVDPLGASGEIFHRLPEHEPDATHVNSH